MQIFSPELMTKNIVDYQIIKGTALGGYVIRDYEYGFLRKHGTEKRVRLKPGVPFRVANPFATHELIRVNQQENQINFDLIADTKGIFVGGIHDIPVLHNIKATVYLRFKITDPHKLTVQNDVLSDEKFLDWMHNFIQTAFLKVSRGGNIFDFINLPAETLEHIEIDGRPFSVNIKFATEELLISMLKEKMDSIGVTLIDMEILNVDMPEEIMKMINEIVEVKKQQIVKVEEMEVELIKERTKLKKKEIEAVSNIIDAFTKVKVDADLWFGTLAKYGLDARTAGILKTLSTTVEGEKASRKSGASSIDKLVEIFSFIYLTQVLKIDDKKISEVTEKVGLPQMDIKSEDVVPNVVKDFGKLIDELYMIKDKIKPDIYQDLQSLKGEAEKIIKREELEKLSENKAKD